MRFGVREICNVVFKTTSERRIGETTFAKGAPVLYFDSLKTSSLEQAVTTVYAQGGRGNTRLVGWDGEKTLTFTMEDALISPIGLSVLAGAKLYEAGTDKKIANGNTLVVHVTEVLEKGKTTVSKTVTAKEGLTPYVFALDEHGEINGAPIAVKITGKQIAKADGEDAVDLPANSAMLVDYYTDNAVAGSVQIDIEPEAFGGNFYIEADTLFRDTVGADHPAQFIIPNGKIQSNFTLTMASSGDPSTFTFTVDAFPGYVNGDLTKKVMAAIQVIKEDGEVLKFDDAAGDIDKAQG